jgi:ATP-binding cassette subfamily C (CFTR/MRP) protein 1
VIKVIGDSSQILSPLVTKALIKYSTNAYYAHRGIEGFKAQSVGYGIGLCFVLWAMQIIYSLCIHQFFVRGAGTGVLARGALIAAVYRRALVLSGKSRTVISNSKLVGHIGTDVSRIDFCAGFFHVRRLVSPLCPLRNADPLSVMKMTWTAPIQLILIVVILLVNLGVSSLAGIFFLLIAV